MRKMTAEWREVRIETLTKNVTCGLSEWKIGPEEYPSLHRFAVTARNFFRDVPMIPGARRVLRRLSKDGYRIRIITHRLFVEYFHAIAVKQTIEWLDHHGIPYKDLCFMKDKGDVGADIYVEDSPENITSLREGKHYTICFANTTNRDVGPPRAKNWDEVYKLIKQEERRLRPSAVTQDRSASRGVLLK
jgi:5'(3')-deoxyribonucleotidase